MKKCYELVINCKDGSLHNLIFSSLKKALHSMSFYPVDSPYADSFVLCTSIFERTLF